MSVKNLTTRGQIRTRKKYDKRRSNKNFSRKLKMNLQGGGDFDAQKAKVIAQLQTIQGAPAAAPAPAPAAAPAAALETGNLKPYYYIHLEKGYVEQTKNNTKQNGFGFDVVNSNKGVIINKVFFKGPAKNIGLEEGMPIMMFDFTKKGSKN